MRNIQTPYYLVICYFPSVAKVEEGRDLWMQVLFSAQLGEESDQTEMSLSLQVAKPVKLPEESGWKVCVGGWEIAFKTPVLSVLSITVKDL